MVRPVGYIVGNEYEDIPEDVEAIDSYSADKCEPCGIPMWLIQFKKNGRGFVFEYCGTFNCSTVGTVPFTSKASEWIYNGSLGS